MLKKHITNIILAKLNEQPTPGQAKLVDLVADFITTEIPRGALIIKGYAGTGKTTLIAAVVNALHEFKINSVLLAPTGRAANVLSNFSGFKASTIHKKIFRQQSSKDGFGKFTLNKNLHASTFFIVDEASMIGNQAQEASVFGSGRLLNDLCDFVFNDKNCKLILIGDSAQLPPVGTDLSPALKSNELSYYNIETIEYTLTDVVRQTANSGILTNATLIRTLIDSGKIILPQLKIDGFNDLKRINGSELISELSDSFDKYGIEETVVICRSNKRANIYNKGIRAQILFREEQINTGDYLMVVKNNYFWLTDETETDFIANGDIVEVIRIKSYQERYGFRFADVTLRLIDHDNKEITAKIILETLDIESAALSVDDNKKLYYNVFEDYADLKPKKKGYDAVKSNPYFNALQVKFAYAVTCHKAQGGQWKSVFIDQGYLTTEMINVEFLRWLYTAITRASEQLYLVNFNKEFYGE
jgi:exodeoxyribonuclease-5